MVSCALLYNFTGKKAEMTKMVNGLHDDEHPL